jgi:hypothetical protein
MFNWFGHHEAFVAPISAAVMEPAWKGHLLMSLFVMETVSGENTHKAN